MQAEEFQEIGHTGGKVTFTIVTDAAGDRQYQIGLNHSRPVQAAIFAVWALPQGVAVAGIKMGGIGTPWNPPPVPGCYPVMIGSDSQGKFGHQCPSCRGYWRSEPAPVLCPYCAARGDLHTFLSEAQRNYVRQYCAKLQEVLGGGEDGECVIDMDAVAEAAGKDGEKPPFYYAEESQQKPFNCATCGAFNDIIGRFCYCSTCGTRNDNSELETDTLAKLRTRANAGGGYESCVSDAVGAFDTFVAQYVRQLVQRVPLRSARKARLERMRFHNLQVTTSEIKAAFDINVLENLKPDDVEFATLMFHRRHIHEHNGSVADEKYLADSGDKSVRFGQEIRETQRSAHRLISLVSEMVKSLHRGFHDIFPPEPQPITRYEESKKFSGAPRVGT
jgi:hypothetical protein